MATLDDLLMELRAIRAELELMRKKPTREQQRKKSRYEAMLKLLDEADRTIPEMASIMHASAPAVRLWIITALDSGAVVRLCEASKGQPAIYRRKKQ